MFQEAFFPENAEELRITWRRVSGELPQMGKQRLISYPGEDHESQSQEEQARGRRADGPSR